MKKIAILAIIALVFTACFIPLQGDEGTLSVSVGSGARAVDYINGIPIANFRHVITLSDGPGADQSMSIDGAGLVTFSVIPGQWTVTIKAYVTDRGDGAGIISGDGLLAIGSVRVEVKPGPNDVVTIPMIWHPLTVSFVSNGGTGVPDQTVSEGKTANQPQISRDGFSFEGWYTEETFKHLWDFENDIVTQNITLYAKWTEIPSKIFSVANTEEWNNAVSSITSDGENRYYVINVIDDFDIAGHNTFTFTFGSVNGIKVSLQGEGRTLSLFGNGSILCIGSNQTVVLQDVTLRGHSSNNTSLVNVGNGTFTMESGKISGNSSSYGGGVYVNSNGTFTMHGGEISGNSSSSGSGGGVYVSGGTFALHDGEISGNSSGSHGGGVDVSHGTFAMHGGKISGNNAYYFGGGVYVFDKGTFIMNGGAISGNTASTGGGVYLAYANSSIDGVFVATDGTFTMNGGAISGNTASTGGGVGVQHGTFTMHGGEISGNTATHNNPFGLAPGGGVIVSSEATFRIITGTIYGSDEDDMGLRNTANPGAALYNIGTAEFGTFSGETWNGKGDLETIDETIRVVEGQLIMNN